MFCWREKSGNHIMFFSNPEGAYRPQSQFNLDEIPLKAIGCKELKGTSPTDTQLSSSKDTTGLGQGSEKLASSHSLGLLPSVAAAEGLFLENKGAKLQA